jgi:uncharacterized protein
MRIAVISDTHDFLDPRIPGLFAGADHILHAGDVGRPRIIFDLEAIAPVTAVLGNTDAGLPLRETEVLELGGRKLLIHHIVDPQNPSDGVRGRLEREQPDVVVFGHTHKPFARSFGGTLFFNPGYAGKSRLGLPRSIGFLHCDLNDIRPEIVQL